MWATLPDPFLFFPLKRSIEINERLMTFSPNCLVHSCQTVELHFRHTRRQAKIAFLQRTVAPLFPSAAQRSRNHSVRATFLHIVPTPLKRERQSENSSSDLYVPPKLSPFIFQTETIFLLFRRLIQLLALSCRQHASRWPPLNNQLPCLFRSHQNILSSFLEAHYSNRIFFRQRL